MANAEDLKIIRTSESAVSASLLKPREQLLHLLVTLTNNFVNIKFNLYYRQNLRPHLLWVCENDSIIQGFI